MSERFDYVVVGAGLAGLSAAIHLQSLGAQVLVLEASDRAGGRVATDCVDGFLCDRGFQLINAKYPALIELGVMDEIDFIPAPRVIEVSLGDKRHPIGDPRTAPFSVFNSATGDIPQKLALLLLLMSKNRGSGSIGEELSKLGQTYERTLRPFLHGVFLSDPKNVDLRYGVATLRSFVSGSPGLPRFGAGELPRALANRVNNLRLNTSVESINGSRLITSDGEISAQKIILATDALTASRLLNIGFDVQMVGCTTWYHVSDSNPSGTGRLIVDGESRGPVINSLVVSDICAAYAPRNQYLISTTTDLKATHSDVIRHLSLMWGVDTRNWQLLTKYEIPQALPLQSVGKALSSPMKISDSLYIAGDYCAVPSQQGALFSGKLAGELAFNSLVLN